MSTKTRLPLPHLPPSSSPCHHFPPIFARAAPPLPQSLSLSISLRPPLSPHLMLIVRSLPLQHQRASLLLYLAALTMLPPMNVTPQHECHHFLSPPLGKGRHSTAGIGVEGANVDVIDKDEDVPSHLAVVIVPLIPFLPSLCPLGSTTTATTTTTTTTTRTTTATTMMTTTTTTTTTTMTTQPPLPRSLSLSPSPHPPAPLSPTQCCLHGSTMLGRRPSPFPPPPSMTTMMQPPPLAQSSVSSLNLPLSPTSLPTRLDYRSRNDTPHFPIPSPLPVDPDKAHGAVMPKDDAAALLFLNATTVRRKRECLPCRLRLGNWRVVNRSPVDDAVDDAASSSSASSVTWPPTPPTTPHRTTASTQTPRSAAPLSLADSKHCLRCPAAGCHGLSICLWSVVIGGAQNLFKVFPCRIFGKACFCFRNEFFLP